MNERARCKGAIRANLRPRHICAQECDTEEGLLDHGASMTTIAVGNLKGGVGTTTLAVNLAALLQHGGHDVTMVDCSGGPDVHRWVQRRQHEGLGDIKYRTWSSNVSSDRGESSYIIVDAGSDRKAVLPLLAHMDLWLAPTPPLFPDFMSTVNLFDLWREARDVQGRPGLFAGVITRVSSNERDLEWTARRKLAFARQHMLVLSQSLARHAAWDATYGGHAMHELPTNVAGVAASEFSAMVVQLFGHGLLALTAPRRPPSIHTSRQASAMNL